MSSELFFIYDSHCPWSYAATALVTNIADAFPEMPINLFHTANYDGESNVSLATINDVIALSKATFGEGYLATLSNNKDSTLAANLLTWVQYKSPNHALSLLKAIQNAHFQAGNPIIDKEDVSSLICELKLSPPAKTLKIEKLTKDAEINLYDISELQDSYWHQSNTSLTLST